MHHPTITENGTTKREICVDEPTAMPMESPALSWMAKRTAEACSHAFPTMGRRIMPMKCGEMLPPSVTPSTAPSKISEEKDTMIVVQKRSTIEVLRDRAGSSSPSSSPPSSSRTCTSRAVPSPRGRSRRRSPRRRPSTSTPPSRSTSRGAPPASPASTPPTHSRSTPR